MDVTHGFVSSKFKKFRMSYRHSSRNKVVKALLSVSFISSCLVAPAVADANSGSDLFQSKCAGCHTLGKGALVGPDLAGTKTWDDEKLSGAIKRMEGSVGPLAANETSDLIAFLKNPPSGDAAKSTDGAQATASDSTKKPADGAQTTSSEQANAEPAKEAPKDELQALGSALDGEMLFDGRKAFSNGGMSCNACHVAGDKGAGLGPDLTKISEKMNDAALLAACQQTPFKVMKAAYASHPVTKEEAASLVKYFNSLKGTQSAHEKFPISLCGGAGSLLILLLIAAGYRNRNNGVRKKLHRR